MEMRLHLFVLQGERDGMVDIVKKICRQHRTWFVVLLGAYATASASYTQFGFSIAEGKYIFFFALFLLLCFALNRAVAVKTRRVQLAGGLLAFLFGTFTVLGTALHADDSLAVFGTSAHAVFTCFAQIVGLSVMFYALLVPLLDCILKSDLTASRGERRYFTANKSSFLLIWAFIFLCWLPYLLAYYPGNFSQDSFRQLSYVIGGYPLDAGHPLIHTAYLGLFGKLGMAMGSLNHGMALYSLSQMLLLSAAFAYTLGRLCRLGVKPSLRVALLLFFALFPVNAAYSVTGWKDILFGALGLLLTVMVFEAVHDPKGYLASKRNIVMTIVVMVLFALYRNNGFHALLIFLPFFFFAFRKQLRATLTIVGSVAAALVLYNVLVFSVFKVPPSPPYHALSIPLQQIARTVRDHRDTMTQQQLDTINELLPVDEIGDLYKPGLSDPIKWVMNVEAYEQNKLRYLKLWAELGVRYPGTYIESFMCLNYGYWYPSTSRWVISARVLEDRIEFPYAEYPLARHSLWPAAETFLARFGAVKLASLPPLSLLYGTGIQFWVLLFSMAVIWVKRRRCWLPFVPSLALWLTTIASPVCAEYRYIYMLVLTAPVCLIMALTLSKKPDEAPDEPVGTEEPAAQPNLPPEA